MTNIRAQMESLDEELNKLEIFDDKDVMTNSQPQRDIIVELEEYQCLIRCIIEKMESLKETINTCAEDAMGYLILIVELEKVKEKASNHEKIVQWLADTQ